MRLDFDRVRPAQVRAALVQGPLRDGRGPRAGLERHGAAPGELERFFYVLRLHERLPLVRSRRLEIIF